jgi:ATP-dependent DNA helicase RecG
MHKIAITKSRRYLPQYSQNTETAVESVTVTLLNLERPSVWNEVSAWIDQEGFIQNAKLREIAKVDTLKASKLLAGWREQGLLVALPDRGKRNMAYTKPAQVDSPTGTDSAEPPRWWQRLFSRPSDNNSQK